MDGGGREVDREGGKERGNGVLQREGREGERRREIGREGGREGRREIWREGGRDGGRV